MSKVTIQEPESSPIKNRNRRAARKLPLATPLRVAALVLASCIAQPLSAATIYILTDAGELATALSENPGTTTTPIALTGVAANDTLVSIDMRPQNQRLYAIGINAVADTVQLYHIAPENGTATPIGLPASYFDGAGNQVDLPDTTWDMDFNPAVDRIRVVSGSGLNFRLNPNTGAPVDGDFGGGMGPIANTNPDGPINGGTTAVTATAYTNNRPNNGGTTTQYTVDGVTNSLYIQNPPNVGTQTAGSAITVGGVPLDFSQASFDIPPGVNAPASSAPVAAGSGFFMANVSGTYGLYSLDLTNGAATLLGNFAGSPRAFAVRTELGAAIALAANGNSVIRFDPASPGTTTTLGINGVNASETLVGIDHRPQTGQLMGLGVNATANTATLYLVDPQTGACTAIGATGSVAFVDAAANPVDLPDPATIGYGIDFNPTVDRVRVVTGSGLNFRVNPNNGAPVDGNLAAAGVNPDGDINGLASGSTGLDGTAYTNSFGQGPGGATTQYTIDATANQLGIQNPPNNGTQTNLLPITLNGTLLDITPFTGFDIPFAVRVVTSNTSAIGEGWFASTVGGTAAVYRLDLSTGAATPFGDLGAGTTSVTGLTVWATEAEIDVEAPTGTVVLDGAGSVNFGQSVIASPQTRTVTIFNRGSHPLSYSTAFATGTHYIVTQGANGTVAGSSSATIEVTFKPTAGGALADTLQILSNDTNEASFEVALTGVGILPQGDDSVATTVGSTLLNPLANDDLAGNVTITAVSNPLIQIVDGRTLLIPEGFTGTFTYTSSNGTNLGQATVTVTEGTEVLNPTAFHGLLQTAGGDLVGSASIKFAANGVATVSLRGGTVATKVKVIIPTGGTSGSSFTNLGNLTVTRNVNGTFSVSLAALGGNITGTLRASRTLASVEKHHIALASVEGAVPGGGYAIATVSAKAAVKVVGVLPDGLPFSAACPLADNGSFAFYTVVTKGAKPPAFVGGTLLVADLLETDVTGELSWFKLPQTAGAKGVHLTGVDTVLTARGSLYENEIPLVGAGTLTVRGGNLVAPEVNSVTVSNKGVPTVPTGSLKTWTGVSPKQGKFNATLLLPGATKPVKGGGLYLPKSNSAWGYFPGSTQGGRIELTVP